MKFPIHHPAYQQAGILESDISGPAILSINKHSKQPQTIESDIFRPAISSDPGPRQKMDPRQRITPQAKRLFGLASRSSVKSRSWVARMVLVLRTGSCRLWVSAKGIHSTAWAIVLLLPAVPAGFSIKYSNQAPAATFTSNLIAMVPLGAILTLVTDELIVRRGGHEALLVVVTTGNLVLLVVTIVTLTKGSVDLVQTSLIGTALSNVLLMVGTGIFIGGIDRFEQYFNQDAVGSLLNELFFITAVLLMMGAFQAWADGAQELKSARITTLSRASSILLVVSYICYALYSYKSHANMFTASHPNAKPLRAETSGADKRGGIARIGLRVAASVSGTHANTIKTTSLASLSSSALVFAVIVDTALLGFSIAFVCDSIDNFSRSRFGLSRQFIGLILLPIVGCNPHAITLARRDQMQQSFAISISGSAQLLLLVLPFTVLLGWMLGNPDMNLSFDGFQVGCLFMSLIGLKYVTAGGKSNWFDGFILIILYCIIALAAWVYPLNDPANINTPFY